jgi:glycosyltransferase involved in cell wall biosynthesis
VSVVLPVYNAGTFLQQALYSIFNQTLRDWELILIDDGSTDGCLSEHDLSDERIRLVRDGVNRGLAARLNEGIDLARGKYLARMDADDVAYPERLEVQANFLTEHPDIDLVAARTLLFREDGIAIGLSPLRTTHEEICAAPWRGFFLAHPTWMGKTEWFRRHRYRLPEFVRCEDQELLLRTYGTSRFACLPDVLLGYRTASLPLGKVLTARKNLALAQWSVNLKLRRPLHATLGFLVALAKALIDSAVAAAGGERLFVSRMARSAPQGEIDRWRRVWGEIRRLPSTQARAPVSHARGEA